MLYLEDSLFPRIRLHRLCPGLHIAIFALCDADGVRHLLLCHVVVIPQILDAVLHANTSVAR